jgi:hypothetical protein
VLARGIKGHLVRGAFGQWFAIELAQEARVQVPPAVSMSRLRGRSISAFWTLFGGPVGCGSIAISSGCSALPPRHAAIRS